MPLIARVAATGERISSFEFKSVHEIYLKYNTKAGDLISPYPDCDIPVFPRGGREGLVLHFVHRRAPLTNFEAHPESLEHMQGKQLIAKRFKNDIEDRADLQIEFEYPVGNRIADVAVIFPTGSLLIGECQLASITPEKLQQRTDDYAKEGADVIWWLGGSADTSVNRKWMLDNFGCCHLISFPYLQQSIKLFERGVA